MKQLNTPVAIFIFKRDKAVDIVKRIGEVKPKKLYILADQGRNDEEKLIAEKCREKVEKAIHWDCEVIKNYAEENRGVYENIGEGAKWVLRREETAIFLEDDNLPEVTFFEFCEQMLEKYKDDKKVLWICGTNYLGDYRPKDGASYVFTKHMLPCGWASWASKFEHVYDGHLDLCDDSEAIKRAKKNYCNRAVFRQYRNSWMGEYKRIRSGQKPVSWDYQMDLTIKAHDLVGICPVRNQIKNIGADELSIHGGTSLTMVMTQRFCGMDSYPVEFPLKHPKDLKIDPVFERKIGKIILLPWASRVRMSIAKTLRRLFKVPAGKSFTKYVKDGFK